VVQVIEHDKSMLQSCYLAAQRRDGSIGLGKITRHPACDRSSRASA